MNTLYIFAISNQPSDNRNGFIRTQYQALWGQRNIAQTSKGKQYLTNILDNKELHKYLNNLEKI